ncbi:MAG: hypothetical protein KAR39_12855 [Thermoplasmata archaeon]|nr:hypothetical protein [Thermoplasmata archaeon]
MNTMSKHNKAVISVAQGISWKQNATQKTRLEMAMIFVGVIMSTLVLGVNLVAQPVLATSGADDFPLAPWTPMWAIILLIGALSLVVGLFAKETLSKRGRLIAIVLGVILLLIPLAPLLITMGEGDDDDIIIPPDPDKWNFDVLNSGDHTDGASFPAGVFTDCDTIFTAANTPEWQSGEAQRDLTKTVPEMKGFITVDQTLARNNEDFTDANCFLVSHSVDLKNGKDTDGDGNTNAVQYEGRIISVSVTSKKASNDTGNYDVIYQDSENRWYIGFQDDGSDWVQSYALSEDFPGGASDSIIIGDHAGGSADTVHMFVMITDYGAFNYDTLVEHDIEIIYEIAGKTFALELTASTVTT